MTEEPAPAVRGVAGLVWVGDGLLEAERAAVSVFDHGLVTGDGVFETIELREGRPFALRRHLARLNRSAAGLGLVAPAPGLVEAAVEAVAAAAVHRSGILRITWTAGPGPLGSVRGAGPPLLVVANGPAPSWSNGRGTPPGEAVAIVPWRRNERGALTGLKTTSYAENVRALAEARRRGASEAIFANTAGELCEGTGANVFVVWEGRLCTPALECGCLAGVTRELVLEVVEASEEHLPLVALTEASEAFLTSTTRGVRPIAAVDGTALPSVPGPLTTAARAAFLACTEGNDDP